jgi:HSP20 family protein
MFAARYEIDRTVPSFSMRRRPFDQPFARLFDDVFSQAVAVAPAPKAIHLEFSVHETADDIVVRANIPGVSAEQLELTVHDNTLTLTLRRDLPTPEGFTAQRRERVPFEVQRAISLPCRVDADRTRAELRDGRLTVTMARMKKESPRLIPVMG